MIWCRGQLVADEALTVSVLDRTFEHGLGLFETLRTYGGRATLLPRHLDRLRRSAAELGLPLDPSELPDGDAVRKLLMESTRADAVLRITLTGGISAEAGSMVWMRTAPLPPEPPDGAARLLRQGRVVVGWSPLARYKALNYWDRRLAHEEARTLGFDEVIINRGGALEGSRTNLFIVKEDLLQTTSTNSPIVPGIMRALVLERARTLGLRIREPRTIFPELVRGADEVFLTNSVRGIIPVGEAHDPRPPGEPAWKWEAPGPITRQLRESVRRWLESGGTLE
jgi:branched-subunit amino acid aminotransferase/4-amino-4-deoxychorismate lyase